MVLFGLGWISVIILIFLGLADMAFYQMAGAAYFAFGILAGAVRTSVRTKLGITGDMVTDGIACCFWMPFAVGQMSGEDFQPASEPKVVEVEAPAPVAVGKDAEDEKMLPEENPAPASVEEDAI
jgi:hypothetical protein